jgi:hypothetical protein
VILEYVQTAMHQAHYDTMTDDGTYCGEIPSFHGVRARHPSLAQCREELSMALQEWMLLRIYYHLPMPVLKGIDLNVWRDESD